MPMQPDMVLLRDDFQVFRLRFSLSQGDLARWLEIPELALVSLAQQARPLRTDRRFSAEIARLAREAGCDPWLLRVVVQRGVG